ncbi:unnamed protein product [Acanthoscelides obtectus]|uniref:RHD domain-containing protein n=1 Tax=Acanthoscelides obtectus TaxID=200917 RepID=A0A9P0KZP1_ACAOB|nr:unnamed protein product [Acanthoscelides obtectus]CAK1677973.1 Embryonic polarity protein dorsal [Acanthoscelides obtectus]
MDVNNLGDAVGEAGKVQTDPTLLSDVIDVIKQDSEFAESTPSDTVAVVDAGRTMFNGGGTVMVRHQADGHQHKSRKKKTDAYIEIVEQPAPKALRFRYECEGRSAGSIPGIYSSAEKRTFPTIRVVGYTGSAWVLVSCVTKDSPYRPHPHNLVGREGCTNGICRLQIPPDTMTISFANLGIQCVKKKDIAQALDQRQRLQVDPFKTGYSHKDQPTSIDLNSVRLCFQVFLPDENNKFNTALKPVVSEPIYDKKAMSDLCITKLSNCNTYVDGGRKHMILLCEKVAKDDIQVRFFEKHGDWEAYADIQPNNVHHQYAIWFTPPKYKTLDVTEPVPVCIQLRRPSDGACSEPVDFEFLPLDSDPSDKKRKRKKIGNPDQFLSQLEQYNQFPGGFPIEFVKTEPRANLTPEPAPMNFPGSPYGDALSPASVASSIPYNFPIGSTPSPESYQLAKTSPNYQGNTLQPDFQAAVTTGNVNMTVTWTQNIANVPQQMEQSWNIPSAANVQQPLQDEANQAEKDICNMDSGEIFRRIYLPSVSSDIDFRDINIPSEQENMQESLNRLENISLGNEQYQSPT